MDGKVMKPVTAITGFVFFIVLFTLALRNPKSTNAAIAAPIGTAVASVNALTAPSK